MPNNDLISRAAALNALLMSKNYRDAHDALEQLPAVDAVPVVHGRWIEVGDFIWKCSVCGAEDCYAYTWGEVKRQDDLYSPKCGAKMDGGDNDV